MTTKRASERVSILVLSCDAYADIWESFFTMLWRYWPDCPFPVYLGAGTRTYSDPRVHSIAIGADLSWASSLDSMLDRIPTSHVMIVLEDVFLLERVDTEAVYRLIDAGLDNNVDCIRLSPLPPLSPPPKTPAPGHPQFGVVEPGTPYRISAGVAVWRIEALRRYLKPGFNAWQFETIGTQLSEEEPHVFWTPYDHVLVYDHAIEKGMWRPEGIEIARREGLTVDLTTRKAMEVDELGESTRAAEEASRRYELKRDAMTAFRRGERANGLRLLGRAIAHEPASGHLWAILACGVAGPRAMRWLRRKYLDRRIAQARKKYDLARRRAMSAGA